MTTHKPWDAIIVGVSVLSMVYARQNAATVHEIDEVILQDAFRLLRFEKDVIQSVVGRAPGDDRLWLRIRNATSDEDVVLSLTELAKVDAYPLKFRFRYFQDFRGELHLPDGFQPKSVVVTAVRDKGGDVQRTFAWSYTEV